MLPVLRLLRFWSLILTGVSGLGWLFITVLLAEWVLDGSPLPARHVIQWLLWLLATASLWLLWLCLGRWLQARDAALRQALARGEGLQASARLGAFVLFAGMLALLLAFAIHELSRGLPGVGLASLALSALLAVPLWQLLWQVARPGPILRMDHQGINHALFGPIPWASVTGIDLESRRHRYGQTHHLCLYVRHPKRFIQYAPLPTRWWLQRSLRRAGTVMGTLRLPLDIVDADPQLVLQAAQHCHDRAGGTSLLGPGGGSGRRARRTATAGYRGQADPA